MAAVSGEPHVEAARWTQRIQNFEKLLEAPPVAPKPGRVRKLWVPPEQRQVRPEAYTPKVLFLGFNNRENPVEDLGVDKYKAEWARQFLMWKAHSDREGDEAGQTSGSSAKYEGLGEQWDHLVRGLEIDVHLARSVYEINTNVAPEIIQKVLALDALFLLLLTLRVESRGVLPQKFFGRNAVTQPHDFGIGYPWAKLFSDMFLLENQVPLYILFRVWRTFPGQSDSVKPPFSDLLYYRFVYLFPEVSLSSSKSLVMEVIAKIRYEECDNLLHCLLELICYNPGPAGEKDYGGELSVPSASSMRKVGMRCARRGRNILHRLSYPQLVLEVYKRVPDADSGCAPHQELLSCTRYILMELGLASCFLA